MMLNQLTKLFTAILASLAAVVFLAIIAAWDAMQRVGGIIAVVYAIIAIIAGIAWLVFYLWQRWYLIQERKADHQTHLATTRATQIETAAKASLAEAEAMSKARILSAEARKKEREAQLFVITANRDQQILISDDDHSRKFTAAHLQLSGQVNGVQIAPTPEQIRAWATWHGPRSQAAIAPLVEETPPPPAALPAIIPALKDRQRILIVGASDAGKTTLLRWLIESRGKCLVLDPQGSPGKWGRATMLGEGLNYPLIENVIRKMAAEMKRRHQEIGSGDVLEGQHEKLTIIIDDLRGIVINCKSLVKDKILSHLVTDGRSTGLNLIVGTHSRYVEALGLQGEGDLRKGFVIVELSGGNGEQWNATLEFNADGHKIPHTLPGPHPIIEEMKARARAAETIETDLESILESDEEPEPDPKPDRAEEIRTMYNEGKTKTEIAQAFGYGANSGAIYYEIKKALG